jgi:hypothetical protein
MAMLSTLVIFKDIIPSYRIRAGDDVISKEIQLKKGTKKIKDYETALLQAYQFYLKFLETTVNNGLGNVKKDISDKLGFGGEAIAKLGLSALRCQCELLRKVSHFNMRTNILSSVINRASQPCDSINRICCETLTNLFLNDVEGEVSYETVCLMAKFFMSVKYDISAQLLRVLESCKLLVHANDAKGLRKAQKKERKKRKKAGDDVDANLLEGNGGNQKSNIKRFQADSLAEVVLIYFRIVKMKIGFRLLPVALEGLGRISHLINCDTAEDLVSVMTKILTATAPSAPTYVKLQCILCSMRTLSGPGAELNLDEEIFITHLKIVMKEIPTDFGRWDLILECINLCLIQKREARNSLVVSFIRLLLLVGSTITSGTVSGTILSFAHSILLRYPRTRASFGTVNLDLENGEEKGDLAMKALRNDHADNDEGEGDGSWIVTLIKQHTDPRLGRVVKAIVSKDIINIPIRLNEANNNDMLFSERASLAFNQISDKLFIPGTGNKFGSAARKNKKQLKLENIKELLKTKLSSNCPVDSISYSILNKNSNESKINKNNQQSNNKLKGDYSFLRNHYSSNAK